MLRTLTMRPWMLAAAMSLAVVWSGHICYTLYGVAGAARLAPAVETLVGRLLVVATVGFVAAVCAVACVEHVRALVLGDARGRDAAAAGQTLLVLGQETVPLPVVPAPPPRLAPARAVARAGSGMRACQPAAVYPSSVAPPPRQEDAVRTWTADETAAYMEGLHEGRQAGRGDGSP